MKANRSLSLLKVNKELNQRVLGKLFYRDPCFTNLIDGKESNQKYRVRNLYKRRLPNLFPNNDHNYNQKTESMFFPIIHIVRGLIVNHESSLKHLFDISLKKEQHSQSSQTDKTKCKKYNSTASIHNPVYSSSSSSSLPYISASKRTSKTYSLSSPHYDIKDDFNDHVNNSINLIDQKYKKKLFLLKSVPFVSIPLKSKMLRMSIIKNEYIKSKLSMG